MEILKRYELLHKYSISTSMIHPLLDDGYIKRVKGGYAILKELDIDAYREQRRLKTNERISNTVSKFFQNENNRLAQSKRLSAYRASMTDEQKQEESIRQSTIMKEVMKDASIRQSISEGMQRYYEETPEAHERVSNNNKKNWKRQEFIQKRSQTIKMNKSTTKSSWADECRAHLEKLGYTVKPEEPYPNDVKKSCDAYVVELDLWIEFHFCPQHNYRPFDETNVEHLNELKELEESAKSSSYDAAIVYNWTKADIERKQLATQGNLNWIAFYSRKDFYDYCDKLLTVCKETLWLQ